LETFFVAGSVPTHLMPEMYETYVCIILNVSIDLVNISLSIESMTSLQMILLSLLLQVLWYSFVTFPSTPYVDLNRKRFARPYFCTFKEFAAGRNPCYYSVCSGWLIGWLFVNLVFFVCLLVLVVYLVVCLFGCLLVS
jgi:hypothetical protein